MMACSISFLLVSVMVAVVVTDVNRNAMASATTLKMEMLHRHHPLLNARPETQLERVKELVTRDKIRHEMIARSHQRRLTVKTEEQEWKKSGGGIEFPMRAGRDYGAGEYFVNFKVGTPPQNFLMIADTGTELTWMNCIYRCRAHHNCTLNPPNRHQRRLSRHVFRSDLSSSFRTIPCSSRTCKVDLSNLFSLTYCPSNHTPCNYDYRFVDGSFATGLFARETVTVHGADGWIRKLKNVLVGCNNNFQGSFENVDGILGLAYSEHSFVWEAMDEFGGKFSYCLVDHLSHKNVFNYLTFGNNSNQSRRTPLSGNVRRTKLEIGLIPPFYALNVKGISIGNLMLDIPIKTWDASQGGGMIIESSTSLASLAQPAYQPVIDILQKSVSTFEKVTVDGVPLEHCFNSTGFKNSIVPRLVIHFMDGARFQPHVKSYVIDVADGVKCLGIVMGKWPGYSVIGNIMQQNYLWEFDLAGGTLGFAPSTCK
ncbi:aspartic proteinase nepenthesin-2 [Tripterygium wilfordii]|uniref:Aspartic proteinase nepenthesin-2 n=1 Tax=Tripterygium wilfordii TaxID=458696 RepID=A0A7J7C206_TRIWF|nr:aspartic proteinase NANA, chloroplast-like [Tripterygium wilfordii]XP_038691931.1 aspartic proteinase NANA, chloroplast-like [Tripterygium wilfordii]KAF5728138.1 aspartic proteinase nepenthesin-2 [Tripterygium wilfordii]KAF5728159.1 aspartic proteinase nepenthesin-2 [Tripterygium wilfordii]